jgi:mannosyl-3-phosphoglycerate phosphatase
MRIVFTDLDGTLLDHEYSWDAARLAIERLKLCNVPWIFVTSKTRSEVEYWRSQMGNHHPFVVENGAAAFVPVNYFSFRIPGAKRRDHYDVLEWGKRYQYLVSRLREAARISRCRVRGFHEMTAAEVSSSCDLPLQQAVLAKLREYDEPFRILDGKRERALIEAIEQQGLRWTKGGRFWHITGANDKAVAVTALQRLYELAHGRLETIGFGDAANDIPFLKVVAVPVLVGSGELARLKAALPHGLIPGQPGPAGWNEIVLKLIPA